MTTQKESLITLDEAEEVATNVTTHKSRTLLMIVTGLGVVMVATFTIMIFISLSGNKTGIETIFPFLEKQNKATLQLPQN